jgi:hypothetical protein
VNSNLKSHTEIFKQEGTSRYERSLPALNPHNVLIDDRKLQDFIAYAQRYSENVLFIDTETDTSDVQTESWESFFKQDIVLLIANIATKNIEEIKKTYDSLAAKFQKENSVGNFIELVDYVFSRFQKINSWYYSSSEDTPLKRDLKLYIGSYLIDDLDALHAIKFYINSLNRTNYTIEDFKIDLFNRNNIPEITELLRKHDRYKNKRNGKDQSAGAEEKGQISLRREIISKISELLRRDNIWDIKDKNIAGTHERIFAGANEEEKLINASVRVDKIFEAVYNVTRNVSNSCCNYLEETINKKQDHAPHIALLIAFIKLYGYVQKELNKIPQRHLDYYYREVLRIKKKAAIPDQVFIVFDIAKGFEAGEIKKGTTVSAGKDSYNVERIYEIDEDININRACVTSLNTISIDKDEDQIINYYSAALKKNGEALYDPSIPKTSWKLFGNIRNEEVSEIGFAIASTQFYLAKGERTIVITFELYEDTQIIKFDTSLIKLLLTGEKGWLNSDVSESRIRVNFLEKTGEKKIELSFTVSIAQVSGVIRYQKELHGTDFNADTPILQCILKYPLRPEDLAQQLSEPWKAQISQLNVLQKLKIIKTSIMVQVGSLKPQISFDGTRDLILENHETTLDVKKPFYPFTPFPRVGSSFYIGCNDLFYKDIKTLSINIEWLLPENFNAYYKNYLPPYDSNKFEATLSILENHVWKKIGEYSIIDIGAKDPKFRSIRLKSDQLYASSNSMESVTDSFDNNRKDRTLRFKLLFPDFGHTIYPQLITSAVMEKASSKSSSVDFYKIVKKELRDSAISIKLPADLDSRTGSLKVIVYDVLERVVDDVQARIIMVKGLSEIIRRVNGSNISLNLGSTTVNASSSDRETGSRIEVNDDNIIERFFGLLRKIRLIPRDVHFDQNEQDTTDVVEGVRERATTLADFIMPSDRELESIITNEINIAISKTVGNIVDRLLEARKTKNDVEPREVNALIRKEFNEANEVINDMIARKIAILLSANEVPPPPYTPLINNISISYLSDSSSEQTGDRFFYITPFGVSEVDLLKYRRKLEKTDVDDESKTSYIFPTSILVADGSKVEMQGMLFIGVKDASVNQNLSLLIQLAEGTKINDRKPSNIIWWYHRNSDWIKLDEQSVISDSTFGFQTTGIIKLSIPADADNAATLFGVEALFWFCASVVDNPDTFPELIDIKAQATTASFKDNGNDPNLLALPLEAERIKGLVDKVPFVKRISQPISSFNGKPEEQEQEYYIRTSERLRHKSRAINSWDYERILLEEFPFLYKVKCLNNYYSGSFLPGHVTVVPISDLRNRNYQGNNVLVPKTNYIDLRKIEKFLGARSSPFVKIHAVNPQLDHILISCKVKFSNKVDRGYSLKRLNEDLVYFLTPWATGDMDSLSFSSKIYASSIINFIDKRDYVDYVQEFSMRQYTENDKGDRSFITLPDQLTALEETLFTTNHSILVSAPFHDIQLIQD